MSTASWHFINTGYICRSFSPQCVSYVVTFLVRRTFTLHVILYTHIIEYFHIHLKVRLYLKIYNTCNSVTRNMQAQSILIKVCIVLLFKAKLHRHGDVVKMQKQWHNSFGHYCAILQNYKLNLRYLLKICFVLVQINVFIFFVHL